MSKIICEICGTSYADTAASCPICGWSQKAGASEAASDEFDLDFLQEEAVDTAVTTEEILEDAPPAPEPVIRKAKPAAAAKNGKEIFDYDAVNSGKTQAQDEEDVEDEEEEEEEEEESRPNTFLVIILVLLIVALLATSGYIFWKYYLPGRNSSETPSGNGNVVAEVVDPTEGEEATVPSVPCTGLSLISGMEKLSYEGQNWLLHVKASPEDTTDVITFMSEDESVAVVNEEGRVTAVGEGETTIVITCGDQTIPCPVVVNYTEENTEETAGVTAEPQENAAESSEGATEATETAAPAEGVKDGIVLKLKLTDITFGIRGVYRTLTLDCDLKPEDCTWSVRDSNVASVTAGGDVYAVGPGLTVVYCKYGNQVAECIVRCNFY